MEIDRTDEFNRIVEMLKSVEPDLDYPNDKHSRAQLARALLGSIDVKDPRAMLAICACGWRGVMWDCPREGYDSGLYSWQHLAGRKGWHWNCPRCGLLIWKYYNKIS